MSLEEIILTILTTQTAILGGIFFRLGGLLKEVELLDQRMKKIEGV
jgi:hypothetical protein